MVIGVWAIFTQSTGNYGIYAFSINNMRAFSLYVGNTIIRVIYDDVIKMELSPFSWNSNRWYHIEYTHYIENAIEY